jgi:hypothetical protein
MYLILTAQCVENGHYRFGISRADRVLITLRLRGRIIYIDLPGFERSRVQPTTFFRFGNLINTTINQWITDNNHNHIPNQETPSKLIFKLTGNVFSYYPSQAH